MSLDRVFKEPIRVSVGTVDGEVKVGGLASFSPTADSLVLQPPSIESGSPTQKALAILPMERIGYLGFHSRYLPVNKARAAAGKVLTVHIAGGRSFMVKAIKTDLNSPIGFYADPVAGGSLYAEMFFFAHAVNATESKEPLGTLLVKEGVNPNAVEQGLAELEKSRSAPIGQILVEQEKLSSIDAEHLAEVQKTHLKHGRPMRLGEILQEAGLATEEDIQSALEEQKLRRGKRLGEILVERGVVDDQKIAMVLAKKFNIPYADLDKIQLNPEAVKLIPADLIARYSILPVDFNDKYITIALSDPLAFEAIDIVRFTASRQIREIVVAPSQLRQRLEQLQSIRLGLGIEVGQILNNLEADNPEDSTAEADITVASDAESGISKLINQIIIDSWKRGASDIHIEPNGPEREVDIRIRIDGICEPYQKVPSAYRSQIVSRVKVMAKLDITERRKPQDGKIRFRFEGQELELRIATIPTFSRDEDVVMRILAKGKPIPLEGLALSARNLREIKKIIHRPYGLILAVGPTGSGKTTTLHALVGGINTGQRKIWTAEDPVEITQEGLRQVQVNSKIGFTFAAAMRSFLRADPDVIMVGEMRDLETASMGIEASLTGHLVFSTLHTNTAPDTVIRLIDMGLDPFVFSDSCLAILAQRLARRLCGKCRERYEASEREQEQFSAYYGATNLQKVLGGRSLILYRAVGCSECTGRGYKGRLALHELLINEKDMRIAIQRRLPAGELRALARKSGMRTLLQDGVEKCIQGLTDIQQVLAVCSE